jgi:hypothetical protein
MDGPPRSVIQESTEPARRVGEVVVPEQIDLLLPDGPNVSAPNNRRHEPTAPERRVGARPRRGYNLSTVLSCPA